MKSAYFDLKIEKNVISLLLSLMSDMSETNYFTKKNINKK